MKIINLQAENIKRLTAIEITPEGNLVEITGKNGQGKTSVLDSIWWALQGVKNIQAVPVRKGEEKATIRLDLGDIVITRGFIAKNDGTFTTSIKVENEDGARFSTPQNMLDQMIGNLAFDPLAFTHMKPTDQLQMLKAFVPDVDFDALNIANAKDFNTRTDINRDQKSAKARAEAIEVLKDCPDAVDVEKLVADLRQAMEHNEDINTRKTNRESITEKIQEKKQQAKDLETRAYELRQEANKLFTDANQLIFEADEWQSKINEAGVLGKHIDIDPIQASIDAAKEINEQAGLAAKKAELIKEAEGFKAQSDKLTKAMDARNKKAKDAITAAKMPVDGIDFGDDCVLLNEVPFEQASDAEQLKASIMIAIAMNPKLKVIRVRDGSLLDEDAMKLMADIAKKHDYQIWIERVDSSGKIGFVIEDGSLKK